ncbi:MAG: PHP domain-containing protein [Anaerolineaceae bacterium]|nr:PHP domain-containing protein [Anaerolineaceae bacterium]
MKLFRCELHTHTVLSPCAEVEMIPPLILHEASTRGIDILAVTDHNASGNVGAMLTAARGSGITILPGMELQTKEEVHLLCIFDTLAAMDSWQAIVDKRLPLLTNQVDYFGEQFLVDETGDFIERVKRLLIVSADISIDEAILSVSQMGGLAIPAHVDRPAFGLIANLGFLPEGIPVEAVEISRHLAPSQAVSKYPQLSGTPLLVGGDAHRLDELLGLNEFWLESPTLAEIRLGLAGKGGRSLRIRNIAS